MTGRQKAKLAELRHTMLHAAVRYHKFLYYVLDMNEITDAEYDALEKQYVAHCAYLKETYPKVWEFFGQPGRWVGTKDLVR